MRASEFDEGIYVAWFMAHANFDDLRQSNPATHPAAYPAVPVGSLGRFISVQLLVTVNLKIFRCRSLPEHTRDHADC